MPRDYLHRHPEFADLNRIVADQRGIDPVLVEKDYWIMHCLYGLQQLGLRFELKGGTSLSKGYRIIDRFSEDIDIRIEPAPEQGVSTNPNQTKPQHIESRRTFYEGLAGSILIDGIVGVARDTAFDDERYYRSGGIRLAYDAIGGSIAGLPGKECPSAFEGSPQSWPQPHPTSALPQVGGPALNLRVARQRCSSSAREQRRCSASLLRTLSINPAMRQCQATMSIVRARRCQIQPETRFAAGSLTSNA